MDVIYKKNMKNNYIVLSNSNIVVNDYRINMLLKNKIKGFLPIYIGCVDGNVEISYAIDSKQSLKQLLERKKLNSIEVKNVIKGIIDVMELAGQYLLKLDDIILENDLIFSDYEFEEIWFCYYPNSKNNFYNELKKLSHELLVITEHSDMVAIEVMYKFFDICNSNDVSIDKIKKCLECNKETFNYYSDDQYSNYEESKVCENHDDVYDFPEKKGKINTIIDKLHDLFIKGKNGSSIKDEELSDTNEDYTEDTYYEEEYNNETILVSDIISSSNRKLLSLTDKNDILITCFPFIVGKLNARADYILDDKLISRMHIKIYKEEEDFFIEDLNSKNGTYLNDIQLAPYDKQKIEIGDKVTIAKYDYIFR